MKIFIKNMVCDRCIASVENLFSSLSIKIKSITLGEVDTLDDISESEIELLQLKLLENGFEMIKNATHQLIEKIKNLIIMKIASLDIEEDFILSSFISEQLSKDYSFISKTFSQQENYTLEHYFILQKIEKVKELLLYNEFTLSEIATKLGYKSVQHLSAQFKTITGFTPTSFKKVKNSHRIPLDKV